MTKTASPNEREASPYAGLLWVTSTRNLPAPGWLGGQTVSEQDQIVRAQAAREHYALGSVFAGYDMPHAIPDERLVTMLELIKQHGIRRLYVSHAMFANDSPEVVETFTAVLKMQGTELVICDA